MKNPEFEALVKGFRLSQDKLIQLKGNDYTIQNEDRLHNFKFVAEQLGITPLQALGVYWLKHILAICTFIKFGKVESEDIGGRFLDEANYNLLGWALLNDLSADKLEPVQPNARSFVKKDMPKVLKSKSRAKSKSKSRSKSHGNNKNGQVKASSYIL